MLTFDFFRSGQITLFCPRIEHLQRLIDFPVFFIDIVQCLTTGEDNKLAGTRRDVDAKVVERIGDLGKLEVEREPHGQVLAQVIN